MNFCVLVLLLCSVVVVTCVTGEKKIELPWMSGLT